MKLELICEKPKGKAQPTPLLFIHGKWHAAWCWAEHFLPFFADHGYVCHALSLRGHGASEGAERLRWTSISDYVEDVSQVAGQMETDPVLIGHSMGGFITQKYLETHTTPAAALLTSVPPGGLWPTTWMIVRSHPLVFMKVLATLRMYPLVATPALAGEAFFRADMPDEKVAAYQKLLGDESIRATLDGLGLNLVRPKRVRTPMLVIGAGKDRRVPLKAIHATAQAYGTSAVIFPKMAHDVMLGEGWLEVAERILTFLKERGI
jgi:pimeloyl-ACP methyl ester carboxylesterase